MIQRAFIAESKDQSEPSGPGRPNVVIHRNVMLTRAQAKARYIWTWTYRNGKPVFAVPTRKVITLRSAFEHKGLCNGPTFSLGLSCHFSCSFCYVSSLLGRNAAVLRILKETGLAFEQIAVERDDPLPVLRKELVAQDGRPRYPNPNDQRVIFASPLIDVAANQVTAQTTIAAARLILENTSWQIRFLSKSALVRTVAEELAAYKSRVIYGLSTGTPDDRLAMSFELRTSTPSARLQTLHWLQDHGFRTYGMLCPILPQQDYSSYADLVVGRIRADRCEHVWAEALNVRGQSLVKTCAGLRQHGFEDEAKLLQTVSGAKNRSAWEEYARATFLALTRVVPPEKLRFMQYVQDGQREWWRQREHLGAVLLGAHAPAALHASSKIDSASENLIARAHLSPAQKAWVTMRQRYSPEQISTRARKAAEQQRAKPAGRDRKVPQDEGATATNSFPLSNLNQRIKL